LGCTRRNSQSEKCCNNKIRRDSRKNFKNKEQEKEKQGSSKKKTSRSRREYDEYEELGGHEPGEVIFLNPSSSPRLLGRMWCYASTRSGWIRLKRRLS
jgi:hypothetical protein